MKGEQNLKVFNVRKLIFILNMMVNITFRLDNSLTISESVKSYNSFAYIIMLFSVS